MRILLGIFLIFMLSGCSFAPKDLKSPCVATESQDGTPVPCVKRSVNDHWLA